MTIKQRIATDLLKRFPNSPLMTLAKKAYKENPLIFTSVESARGVIRTWSGNHKHRPNSGKVNGTHREKTYNSGVFSMPESHANTYEPYVINQSKILVLSDLHFPYQDNKAIIAAIEYGKKKGVNCILLNGDILDFANISRHEKDWRHRNINEEFEAVRAFLKELRKHFPKAKIVFKQGNHDERWEKFLYLKAPEIFDMPEFQLDILLKFGELKIDMVKDKLPIKVGKLTVLHGNELTGSGGVNPARATFIKTLNSVLIGHVHKTSVHSETRMDGEVINVHSTGCLCDMHPMYMPINKWNLGFAYIEHNIKTGEYQIENKIIIKNKVY